MLLARLGRDPFALGQAPDDVHARALLHELRHFRRMSFAPDVDVEPEPTGLDRKSVV